MPTTYYLVEEETASTLEYEIGAMRLKLIESGVERDAANKAITGLFSVLLQIRLGETVTKS